MRLFLTLCVVFFVTTLQAKQLSVSVSAPAAILINAETGDILYAKKIHEKKLPASITKIATALYVLEKKGGSLDEIAIASRQALLSVASAIRLAEGSTHPPYRLELDGTMIGLRQGERASLLTLLYGLMLSSGNDAGNVLAEAVSGSVDCFMEELNQFLKQRGILETHFSNPHGLHHDDHWTTAYDMAQITRLAFKHPLFREIVKTTRYLKPQSEEYFIQHNRLLKPGALYYPKAIGVKNGYHWRAGFTFVGAAAHEGRTLIAVVLQCDDARASLRDTTKLFEAAFSEKKISRTLFASESDRFMHQIRGITEPLQAVLKEDAILEYYPAEEPQFRAEVVWTYKKFPLQIGDVVGRLRCIDEKGNLLLQKPLFASNEVSKSTWMAVVDFCKEHKSLFVALFLGGQVILLLIYLFKKHQKIRQR